ncbi:Hypothetical protein NGAL_HAMBI1146_23520 [Neorhizobium galegae bv. officinalis]|nr:Hypothetical protein NGAL_HAMBI1146_23520 [Neorhizobium galegae bv. officinalis]
MSNVVSLRPKRVRPPQHIGAFFELGPTYANGDHGLELENGDKLITPPRVMLGPGPDQKYGFLNFQRFRYSGLKNSIMIAHPKILSSSISIGLSRNV